MESDSRGPTEGTGTEGIEKVIKISGTKEMILGNTNPTYFTGDRRTGLGLSMLQLAVLNSYLIHDQCCTPLESHRNPRWEHCNSKNRPRYVNWCEISLRRVVFFTSLKRIISESLTKIFN